MVSYQERVPAVAKAVEAVRCLVRADEPLSLSEIARSIGSSPSSTLAVLSTLRGYGLVTRLDERAAGTGPSYEPGPGLVALGAAAADRLDAFHAFERLAPGLVRETGETALLWIRHDTAPTFVLAAVREGTAPLRFVPEVGARIAIDLSAGGTTLVDLELEPGVRLLGVPLPTHRVGESVLISLAGPRERMGASIRLTLLSALGEGAAGSDDPGRIEAGDLDAFLGQGLVATLSYLADDGYPATVPLWYDWDGRNFWLVPRPGAEWAKHVRRNPRVSLAVSESAPPLRRVLARGAVESVEDPGGVLWRPLADRLRRRYAGLDAARYLLGAPPSHVLRLAPERLIAWRGLLSHPRLAASRPASERDSA